MLERSTAWLRPVLLLLSLAGLLSLAACGGGNGAINNPNPPQGPVITPISILPNGGTAYSGIPFTLTISGGVPPYTAVSTNPAILPVAATVAGTSLVLLPSTVASDTSVQVTLRDQVGQTASVSVLVKPSLLLPTAITIQGSPACKGGGQLCSGTTGTATVKVTGPGGAGIAGRQVRFEVVQGDFALLTTNPLAPQASTLTVVTDQNGDAIAGLIVPPSAVSQLGVLRATEVNTGVQVTGQFTIVQQIAGTTILSVIPSGKTTIKALYKDECSAGVRTSFYVFGGTPPYRVSPSYPDAVAVIPAIVPAQGGNFDVITNGQCFTGLTFAIVDQNGLTLTNPPTVDNVPGDADRPTVVPVTPLVVSPGSYTITPPASCAGRTFNFTITGTPPFSAAASTPSPPLVLNTPIGASPGTLAVSNVPSGTTIITIGDSNKPQQLTSVAIICP